MEQMIWLDFKQTGSPETKEFLILHYAPLVRDLARGFRFKTPPEIEYADLVGYGFLGLIDAIEKFDPGRGTDFSVYARIRIKGAISDGVRTERRLPRSVQAKARRIGAAYEVLSERLLRSPSENEVADYLGIEIDKYRRISAYIENSYVLSLNDLTYSSDADNGDLSLFDLLRDENAEDPSDVSEREDLRAAVRLNVERLPEREKMVIYLYYCEELSMKEVGEVLGITESRVSQIHGDAISRLRTLLSAQLDLQPA